MESKVTCETINDTPKCNVTAQRPSELSHSGDITFLSDMNIAVGLSEMLPNATKSSTLSNSDDDTLQYIFSYDVGDSRDLSLDGLNFSIPLEIFSIRFIQVLNAFIHASLYNAPKYIMGTDLNESSIIKKAKDNSNFALSQDQMPYVFTVTDFQNAFARGQKAVIVTGEVQDAEQFYVLCKSWPLAFIFATTVMSMAGMAGIYADFRRCCPDYLGCVSSLARESPHVDLPPGGVNLDGMGRARKLKDLKVRLGDVGEGGSGNRQLRLGRMERTERARKGFLYE